MLSPYTEMDIIRRIFDSRNFSGFVILDEDKLMIYTSPIPFTVESPQGCAFFYALLANYMNDVCMRLSGKEPEENGKNSPGLRSWKQPRRD